jgi:hypothetical protein
MTFVTWRRGGLMDEHRGRWLPIGSVIERLNHAPDTRTTLLKEEPDDSQ